MKTLQIISALLLFTFYSLTLQAQEEKRYVIQLATYSSWDNFLKDKDRFKPLSDDQVWVEQVGNLIKAYKLRYNGEYEEYLSFYEGPRLDQELKRAREHFKDAFRKSDENIKQLKMAWEIFNEHEKQGTLPSEFVVKGSRINVPSSGSSYKIQLGAFKEQKPYAYIADRYGFSETEKQMADSYLSHDFKKVNNVVCRRYFFGNFDSKSEAMAKKKALEKNSNRKLLLVKM